MKFALLAAAVSALFITAPATAQTVTVGQANSGNCYPFSCGPTDSLTGYQQSYRPGAFTSALTFNTISFTRFTGAQLGPDYDAGTYTIAFYLASTAFNGLSTNLASNRGTLLGTLGTFTLGGPSSAILSLTGTTINYDPSMGALLMDVAISNPTGQGGYNVFFDADYTGADTLRAYDGTAFGATANDVGALQTTFSLAGAVPEPATWAFMILGFGAIGGAMRSRRRVTTRVAYA